MITPRNAVAFVIIHPQVSKSRRHEDNFSSHPLRYLWVNDYKGNGISEHYHYLFCDVRHRLHCLVLIDTNLYNVTRGKNLPCKSKMASYYMQHPCYDVGCYPWHYIEPLSAHQRNAIRMAFRWWTDSGLRLYAGWDSIKKSLYVLVSWW